MIFLLLFSSYCSRICPTLIPITAFVSALILRPSPCARARGATEPQKFRGGRKLSLQIGRLRLSETKQLNEGLTVPVGTTGLPTQGILHTVLPYWECVSSIPPATPEAPPQQHNPRVLKGVLTLCCPQSIPQPRGRDDFRRGTRWGGRKGMLLRSVQTRPVPEEDIL